MVFASASRSVEDLDMSASAEAKDNLTKAFESVDFKSRMWQATLYENRKMGVTVEDFNPKFSQSPNKINPNQTVHWHFNLSDLDNAD